MSSVAIATLVRPESRVRTPSTKPVGQVVGERARCDELAHEPALVEVQERQLLPDDRVVQVGEQGLGPGGQHCVEFVIQVRRAWRRRGARVASAAGRNSQCGHSGAAARACSVRAKQLLRPARRSW